MPRSDGTGPTGAGPGTGRKRGWCLTGRNSSHGDKILSTIVIPAVGMVFKDLTNKQGLIRGTLPRLIGKFIKTQKRKRIERIL